MSGKAFYGGTWVSKTGRRKVIGATWRRATRSKIYKGGGWHDAETYVLPLSASVTPSDATGSTSGHFGATVTSNYVTVTPVGGLGPFTYSWAVGSGITASNPTSATTQFSKFLSPFQETIASATCTVTDSLGSTATADVEIDLVHEGL